MPPPAFPRCSGSTLRSAPRRWPIAGWRNWIATKSASRGNRQCPGRRRVRRHGGWPPSRAVRWLLHGQPVGRRCRDAGDARSGSGSPRRLPVSRDAPGTRSTTSESAGWWKRPARRPPRRSSSIAACSRSGIRRKLGLPSRFEGRFGQPLDVQALASNWPRLPFIIPHFGAGFFREALMAADMSRNIVLDTSSSNDWISTRPGSSCATSSGMPSACAAPIACCSGPTPRFSPGGGSAPCSKRSSQPSTRLDCPQRIASSFSAAHSTGSSRRHPETLPTIRAPSDEAPTAQVGLATAYLVNSARCDRSVVGPSQVHTRDVLS